MNMPNISRPLAFFCLALSMSLVGSYVALSKSLTLVFPVFLLAWLRFGIGGLAMLHWFKKPPNEMPLTANTKRLVFLESLIGNFLFSICMLYGVSMTSAVSAGVVLSAIPAVVALLSWIFLKERISAQVWMGVACAMTAISLLALTKSAPSTVAMPNELLGNLLVFVAVVCEACYAVIGKKLTATLGPRRITSLINLWGFILMTPLGLYAALSFEFSTVPLATWVLLLFYSLAASVWTVWLWMTGLKVVDASQAGVFTVMLPISAAVVGVVVLGESLTERQIIAFVLALVGVVLATRPQKERVTSTN
jgi:drug/metabolite transporter (DMT)-like permease